MADNKKDQKKDADKKDELEDDDKPKEPTFWEKTEAVIIIVAKVDVY